MPSSAKVGTSRKSGMRAGEEKASARTAFARILALAAVRLSIMEGTTPAITSVAACAPPR
jgi:hypothetical protein